MYSCARTCRLPNLFVGNEKLNQHIIQLSISWVLALHSKDYKLNETGGCLGVGALGWVPRCAFRRTQLRLREGSSIL